MGSTFYWRQDYTAAVHLYDGSLVLRQERSDEWTAEHQKRWGEAATLHSLANLAMSRDEYAEALAFFEQALVLRRQQGDMLGWLEPWED